MNEEWRVVSGFPDYEISNLGRLRRVSGWRGARIGRILRGSRKPGWYPKAHLWKHNKRTAVFFHQLVAVAFLGPCPEGFEVNHKDGNKENPALGNLEYRTRPGNVQHAFDTGLHVSLYGEDSPSAKLTEAQVVAIREAAATDTYPSIAKRFGIETARVSRICRGKLWPKAGGPIWPRRKHGNNQHKVEYAARPVTVAVNGGK